MGYWENTGYVAHEGVDAVAAAIVALFAEEGRALVARPPRRRPGAYDAMQYGDGRTNALWAVALFPGSTGWTVVKTAPLELLAETGPNRSRMRWIDLCERLGAPGFQLHLYDSTGAVLVETDGRGALSLSGAAIGGNDDDDDPLVFHGLHVDEARIEPRFDVLPLANEIDACRRSAGDFDVVDHDHLAERLARRCGGANAAHCDNLTIVTKLVPHEPLAIAGGRDLYFTRSG